jgi:hypothetical protein
VADQEFLYKDLTYAIPSADPSFHSGLRLPSDSPSLRSGQASGQAGRPGICVRRGSFD